MPQFPCGVHYLNCLLCFACCVLLAVVCLLCVACFAWLAVVCLLRFGCGALRAVLRLLSFAVLCFIALLDRLLPVSCLLSVLAVHAPSVRLHALYLYASIMNPHDPYASVMHPYGSICIISFRYTSVCKTFCTHSSESIGNQ